MVQSIYPPPAPPPRPSARPTDVPLWKCMCDGCGAPLQRHELQCSYCLRAVVVAAAFQPSGVITCDAPITAEAAARIKAHFEAAFSQPGKVLVLGPGMRYQPLREPKDDTFR